MVGAKGGHLGRQIVTVLFLVSRGRHRVSKVWSVGQFGSTIVSNVASGSVRQLPLAPETFIIMALIRKRCFCSPCKILPLHVIDRNRYRMLNVLVPIISWEAGDRIEIEMQM